MISCTRLIWLSQWTKSDSQIDRDTMNTKRLTGSSARQATSNLHRAAAERDWTAGTNSRSWLPARAPSRVSVPATSGQQKNLAHARTLLIGWPCESCALLSANQRQIALYGNVRIGQHSRATSRPLWPPAAIPWLSSAHLRQNDRAYVIDRVISPSLIRLRISFVPHTDYIENR